MVNSAIGDGSKPSDFGLLRRPPQTLHELPIEYRWEVTRRHPYYLQLWELAHRYQHNLLKQPGEQQLGQAAVLILQVIGFTHDPLPPSSGPEALELNQLGKAWQGGAVAPLMVRGMVGMLINDLPPASRKYVGELLLRSVAPSTDDETRKYELVTELTNARHTGLDGVPNRPILSINVHAPQRAIVEAVEQCVRKWKEQMGIPERRRRDDMLPGYLAAWDQREGWSGNGYEIGQERSFRQIAGRLSVPARTVANRYYSAFELVCGHEYSFETWVKLFIVVKLNTVLGNQALRRRRALSTPRQTGAVGQVAEPFVAVDFGARDGGVIAGAIDELFQYADADLMMDLCELIKKGFNEDVIVRELELPDEPESRSLIQYLRKRREDNDTD